MSLARDERWLLCQLFEELGPEAPTLCEGWNARDLAVHLVVRERRGRVQLLRRMRIFSGYVKRVERSYAVKPWPELVELVRSGPSVWSPLKVDSTLNTAEFFVHHEDLRRAQTDWQPRPADPNRDAALWRCTGLLGRLMYRKSPVGVIFRLGSADGGTQQIKRGPTPVTITGEPGELLLYSFGRDQVRLDFDGPADAVHAVKTLKRSV